MKYIDAHCHTVSESHRGVGFIVNATRPADWDKVIDLARRDDVYGAIGVHPWFVSELHDGWNGGLINALVANPNLMVGEIGLDNNHPDLELQENIFRRQLQIAHDMKRVAHIHCVGTWGKIMEILRGAALPPVLVFHAYSGSVELMSELADMGAYFSFGTEICNEKHVRARAAVAVVPESRILIESDDVASDTIPTTIAEIAQIRGVNVEEMAKIVYNNTMVVINGGKI